ncbi:type 4b pilus protein PilO2 [Burkholderia vietnamiensis]|uniref:type 4b pilus protein PilO2 n=1 Tax=Burkholderia vietnamiensis TaxID=60552 RepID=UPI001B9D4F7D|nr:type 4b pilus protein PilO2 [Burkholderia vietnamiensis]MBR7919738.1 type 4b pilus protein PilO2 [Burkholderia vietnamiensis]MBR8205241.1 type 4b pilus protein PilO2 [Burkholderia vietnamiensis]
MNDRSFSGGGGSRVTITAINGKEFVSGLLWEMLQRPRHYMSDARDFGKRHGMDIVAVRKAAMLLQAGFVAKNQGALKGMYSMAAALSGILGDSWIGAFSLGDGRYVFVAVHGKVIIPGCDFVGFREEVEEKLRTVYTYHAKEWEEVYAPADFEFGNRELDLAQVLAPASLESAYMLKPLRFAVKEVALYSGVGIALIGAIVGGLVWHNGQEKKKALEAARAEIQRQAELAKLNAHTKKLQTQKALEHPWAKQLAATEFVEACKRAIAAADHTGPLQAYLGSWLLDDIECDGSRLVLKYNWQGSSTIEEFRALAQRHLGQTPTFNDAGTVGTVVEPMQVTYSGDDKLVPYEAVRQAFQSHFDALHVFDAPVALTEVKAPQPSQPPQLPGAPGSQVPAPPQPDWRTFSFNMSTGFDPSMLFEKFNLPGLRVTNLTMTLKVSDAQPINWTIAGSLYAK